MAANLTPEIALQEAVALQSVMELVAATVNECKAALAHNVSQSIDWNTLAPPEVTLDSEGNIAGTRFTPAMLSNAIYSMQVLVDVMTNGTPPSQGDYIGNINLVAKPQTVRSDRI